MSVETSLTLHPSGLYLHAPSFPGFGEWFAGFTTLKAGGTLDPVFSLWERGTLPVLRPAQVHGNRVVGIAGPDLPVPFREEADGLATGLGGLVLAVASADCVPMILFDGRTRAGADPGRVR